MNQPATAEPCDRCSQGTRSHVTRLGTVKLLDLAAKNRRYVYVDPQCAEYLLTETIEYALATE